MIKFMKLVKYFIEEKDKYQDVPFKHASENVSHQDRSSACVDGHKKKDVLIKADIKKILDEKDEEESNGNRI